MQRPLDALPIHVRMARLEKTESYLERLFAANFLDSTAIDRDIRYYRKEDGVDLGAARQAIIKDRGAVRSEQHWDRRPTHSDGERCDRCFLGQSMRYACRSCANGAIAHQLPHLEFNVCRRHSTWIGPGCPPEQQHRVGSAVLRAERAFRRMRALGQLEAPMFSSLFATLRRWNDASSGGMRDSELYPLLMEIASELYANAILPR